MARMLDSLQLISIFFLPVAAGSEGSKYFGPIKMQAERQDAQNDRNRQLVSFSSCDSMRTEDGIEDIYFFDTTFTPNYDTVPRYDAVQVLGAEELQNEGLKKKKIKSSPGHRMI